MEFPFSMRLIYVFKEDIFSVTALWPAEEWNVKRSEKSVWSFSIQKLDTKFFFPLSGVGRIGRLQPGGVGKLKVHNEITTGSGVTHIPARRFKRIMVKGKHYPKRIFMWLFELESIPISFFLVQVIERFPLKSSGLFDVTAWRGIHVGLRQLPSKFWL